MLGGIESFAILDDGLERTILLHNAAQQLGLQGQCEKLALRTIQQDSKVVSGVFPRGSIGI